MNPTLDKFLKTAGVLCAMVATGTGAGLIPATAGIIIGLVGVICAALANSPAWAANGTFTSKVFTGIAVALAAASSSTFFPGVQHLFNSGTAQKIAGFVTLGATAFAYLGQMPGAAAAAAMLPLVGLLALGATGCTATSGTPPVVTPGTLDCSAASALTGALSIAGEVAADLASSNYVDLLATLTLKTSIDVVKCAVELAVSHFDAQHAASGDAVMGNSAARGRAWLATH